MKKVKVKQVAMIVIILGCLSYAIPRIIHHVQLSQQHNHHVQAGQSNRSRPTPVANFDLGFSLIDSKQIRSGGPAKDGIPALTDPQFIPAAKADYLKGDDEIIGVTIAGQTRAYPLNILNYHEIVNDTLAEIPIAVTYCPLCRSALVFDRKIGDDILEFGVSGLLWNSNVLMYDRRSESDQESLWSQILMKAVTGPAAQKDLKLTLRTSELTTWQQWQKSHPKTEVLSVDTGHHRNYFAPAYGRYFQTDQIMFPVTQNGEKPQRFVNKEPMILVQNGKQSKAYAVSDIARASSDQPYLEDQWADTTLCLKKEINHDTVKVIDMNQTDRQLPVAYLFWFSLNAILPEVEIYQPIDLKAKI